MPVVTDQNTSEHPIGGLSSQISRQNAAYYTNNTIPADEIDLIDVAAVLWRSRYFAAVGVVAGTIIAYIGTIMIQSKRYQTQVSIAIDPASLPAVSLSKDVIPGVTGVLNSPAFAYEVLEKVVSIAPEFADSLEKSGNDTAEIVSAQTVLEGKNLPLALKPTQNDLDFVLEATFPAKGMGEKAGDALVTGLNAAISARNLAVIQGVQSKSKQISDEVRTILDTNLKDARTKAISMEKEVSNLLLKISSLEYGLTKMAKKQGDALDFARRNLNPALIVATDRRTEPVKDGTSTGTSSKPVLDDIAPRIEAIIKMTAALEREKQLSTAETAKIVDEIAELRLAHQNAKGRLEVYSDLDGETYRKLTDAEKLSRFPLDRATMLLPLFKLNERAFKASYSAGATEQLLKPRSVGLLLGALAGGFLGIMIGVVVSFMRTNRERLRALIAA